jgi:hypothetical protein
MASADSCFHTTRIAPHTAAQLASCSPFFGVSFLTYLFCISPTWRGLPHRCRDIWVPVAPAGDFTGNYIMPHGKQVSPDKNVNFPCAAAPFTVSPVPRALTCCAALPRDSALYGVSVRQFASLHSGFLQTLPHGNALAFG